MTRVLPVIKQRRDTLTQKCKLNIYIDVPSSSERQEILQALTAHVPLSSDVDLAKLARKTPGFVGADLTLLCKEAAFNRFRIADKEHRNIRVKNVFIRQADFTDVLKCLRPSIQRSSVWCTEVKPVHWAEIGGLDNVKKRIKICVEWPILYSDVLSKMGLPHPCGILLFGPPGCCKTTLIRAVATQCNINFFSVSAAHIYSPFVGDSEKAISEVFQKARLAAPSIIFFDELDSLVGKRTFKGKSHGIQEKVLSVLLNEMDGIGLRVDEVIGCNKKVLEGVSTLNNMQSSGNRISKNIIVIGATNRPDMIDDALMRSGRFDVVLYVPHPDQKARHSILNILTRKMPIIDVDLNWLSKQTDRFTGADLSNLCREAALQSISQNGFHSNHVYQHHFCEALQYVKPSIDIMHELLYERTAKKYSYNILNSF